MSKQHMWRRSVVGGCALGIALLGLLACLPNSVSAQSAELNQTIERGVALDRAGQYVEALPFYRKALDMVQREFGADHIAMADMLNGLASLYLDLGQHDGAEPLLKRSLAIRKSALGSDHPKIALSLNNIAGVYTRQGRYDEAEPLFKRSLSIWEKSVGPQHPRVAMTLNNLAEVYLYQGRYGDAEALYRRSLTIREQVLGPRHPDVGGSLNNLGELYRRQGRYDDAEWYLRRALEIWQETLGHDHPSVGAGFNNLALVLMLRERIAEAMEAYNLALTIREKALGPNHPDVGQTLNNLASLALKLGHHGEAESLYQRTYEIMEKALGPRHPNMVVPLTNLAMVFADQNQEHKALEFFRRATTVYSVRATSVEEHSVGFLSERRSVREIFIAHIGVAIAVARKDPSKSTSMTGETFSVSQLARSTQAGTAVSRMAARFAAGNDQLASTVRDLQDIVVLRQMLDAQLIKAVSAPPDRRDPVTERSLRERLSGTSSHIEALTEKLAAEFPQYVELTAAKPVALLEVQNLLGSREALVAYLVGTEETYVWVVRRDKAVVFIADVGRSALSDAVAELRDGLDPTDISSLADLPPFNTSAAYKLFNAILEPAEELLVGASHVFVVPDSALQSLPLGVLVTEEPQGKFTDFSGYRQTPWLAKKYALTTLPSVSSLSALRTYARRALGTIPFIGVGDPLLKGHPGGNRGIRLATLYRGAIANVEAVRNLSPLSDTADELRALSRAVNGSPEHVFLRAQATETAVKEMDLTSGRVLAFANHGLVAGDLKNAEPALVLTPPEKGTLLDDGLLTAGEVANLKLNADLVILSACNTAAGDGTDGAEALSGLAKPFFYAGSRALLVSHWPVLSDAAVNLTTRMLRYRAKNLGTGWAEALRQSMLALMNDKSKPYYAHPMFWAPFVVVGEGKI